MADPLALRSESIAEFTFKAVAAGVVLGVLFGAANAYLGLRVGMTVSASIPAAVMAVVVFRALKLRSTILEVNLAQTIGSASTALATGTIFTIPALFLWGMVPPYMQVVALSPHDSMAPAQAAFRAAFPAAYREIKVGSEIAI